MVSNIYLHENCTITATLVYYGMPNAIKINGRSLVIDCCFVVIVTESFVVFLKSMVVLIIDSHSLVIDCRFVVIVGRSHRIIRRFLKNDGLVIDCRYAVIKVVLL